MLALVGITLTELLNTNPLISTDSPGGQNWVITALLAEKLQDESEGVGLPCGPAAWAFGVRILPKKLHNLQEKSQSSWPGDHPVG